MTMMITSVRPPKTPPITCARFIGGGVGASAAKGEITPSVELEVGKLDDGKLEDGKLDTGKLVV